jgi:hypothetical protein
MVDQVVEVISVPGQFLSSSFERNAPAGKETPVCNDHAIHVLRSLHCRLIAQFSLYQSARNLCCA